MAFRSESSAAKKARDKREEALKRLREGRKQHERWISSQFANRHDVLRDARDIVDDYEQAQGLEPGTIEPVFEDSGANIGYFLRMSVDHNVPDTRDLIDRIRSKTGEWFEVELK